MKTIPAQSLRANMDRVGESNRDNDICPDVSCEFLNLSIIMPATVSSGDHQTKLITTQS